jgi:hypothetical protein
MTQISTEQHRLSFHHARQLGQRDLVGQSPKFALQHVSPFQITGGHDS